MQLISPQFFLFFLVIVTIYFAIPHKSRSWLLLIVSCLFYLSFIPVYIFILFGLIIVDYLAGLYLEKTKSVPLKRAILLFSIISSISTLFVFKYLNFFVGNTFALAKFIDWNYSITALEIIIPIGLSFHIFQSLAYVIEVFKKKQKAERSLKIYALYVMFFPQLLAGPIERPQNVLHQFKIRQKFDYQRVIKGFRLILWGAFQKVVIADRLAFVVNSIYNNPHQYTGFPLILATFFFAFQIFCDFAGYSNIARGTAQVLGINLMINFDRPYSSKSVSEFWRRWHISLSSWFRDYLYIPLGGNQVSRWRWHFNILLVFSISGFWHGANWNFIIWGILHGIYIVIETWAGHIKQILVPKIVLNLPQNISTFLQIFLTFSLVSFAWIFFRANSLDDATYIVTHLFKNLDTQINLVEKFNIDSFILFVNQNDKVFGLNFIDFIVVIIALIVMESVHFAQGRTNINSWISRKPVFIRWLIYYALFIPIIYYSAFKHEQFIYFQF